MEAKVNIFGHVSFLLNEAMSNSEVLVGDSGTMVKIKQRKFPHPEVWLVAVWESRYRRAHRGSILTLLAPWRCVCHCIQCIVIYKLYKMNRTCQICVKWAPKNAQLSLFTCRNARRFISNHSHVNLKFYQYIAPERLNFMGPIRRHRVTWTARK